MAARAAVCGLYLVFAAFLGIAGAQPNAAEPPAAAAMFGGTFQLIDHNGQPFGSDQLRGYAFALFFGFTHCPDVCPTTLLEMTHRLTELGPDADRLKVLFVSVDPERDTPEHLKAYLASFDHRIIGLTGNPAEVASVAHAFRASYEKVPTSSGYTLHHTVKVFLIDRHGQLSNTMGYEEGETVQRQKLRFLLSR